MILMGCGVTRWRLLLSKLLVLLLLGVFLSLLSCSRLPRDDAVKSYHASKEVEDVGYRSQASVVEYSVSREGEAIWRKPPTQVRVQRNIKGPEKGDYTHDPLTPEFTGYEKGDAQIYLEEVGVQGARDLSRRDPVNEMPDYMQGDYGSNAGDN